MDTIRILLSVVVNKFWNLYQMDVRNVFLKGTLEEEVYMKLFLGHEKKNPKLTCRLKKSIMD
jgi:Reverse transcriptase (RNA-dependent DNA polymerase)